MSRYRATTYDQPELLDGLNQGIATGQRVMSLVDAARKFKNEEEKKAALSNAAGQTPTEEVGRGDAIAAATDAYKNAMAQAGDDPAKQAAVRDQYVPIFQGIQDTRPEAAQYRLGDVVSDKPLTTDQTNDARLGLQSAVLAKHGDVDGATKLNRERRDLRNDGVTHELNTFKLDDARSKAAADKARKEVNEGAAAFLRQRATVTGADGTVTMRPLTDDDFIAAGNQQMVGLASAGLYDDAEKVRAAVREKQVAIVKKQSEDRKRDIGYVLATIQGDPEAGASALEKFYDKYVPDGRTGKIVFDPKSKSYTIKHDGGGFTMDVDSTRKMLQGMADPDYMINVLDYDAKLLAADKTRAEIKKIGAETAKLGAETQKTKAEADELKGPGGAKAKDILNARDKLKSEIRQRLNLGTTQFDRLDDDQKARIQAQYDAAARAIDDDKNLEDVLSGRTDVFLNPPKSGSSLTGRPLPPNVAALIQNAK